ncbi:peroxiredoxin family protein [Ureibacillus sp. GCM10028918]|uniref:peroxiredoxin family protein n=1 Tax=Ureibacillus sp. GCM10028918 TaxID=3273429 RepID=UPI0036F32B9F
MPSKKIVTICISLLILAGVIYTIATNIYIVKERQMVGEELETSSLVEQGQPLDQSVSVNTEKGTDEYQSVEEPEVSDSATDEEHNQQFEQDTGTRTISVAAPNFELRSLAEDKVRLSDFKGKKVVINFWATWCIPCVEEMPAMQNFYDEHAAMGNVEILAVNATDKESNTDIVKQFVQEFGISFPILLDEKGDVLFNYEVLTLPTSLIIDEQGMVVEQILGPVTEELLVEKLL